jgi:osmotically-inducible protein OsmY
MKTDAQLKRDIIAELTWETSVNAPQIGVEVKNGTVKLAGHVDSYTEKWQAAESASTCRRESRRSPARENVLLRAN